VAMTSCYALAAAAVIMLLPSSTRPIKLNAADVHSTRNETPIMMFFPNFAILHYEAPMFQST